MKNIAVLTSGGDAPGMNAAIRAVVRIALLEKLKVFGIYNGYQGLVDNQIQPLNKKSVGNIIHRGGTILKSARSKDFQTKEGRNKAYHNLVEHQIDAVIVIGGDGTFAGAIQFTQEFNIPFVGIPGTIDNDLFGTEYTIGFKSAVQTAMECVDKIRDTANAFKRLFFIEVMGRDVGAIALATGIATGAEDIFIPETKTNLNDLSERLKRGTDKESYIIIVSEGDDKGGAENIAAEFKKTHPEYDIKTLVLGHLLRGGNPTAEDRILAARLGVAAVQSLIQKEFNVMIGIQRNEIAKTPLHLCKKHFLKINQEWEDLIYKLS
ncbi:MAG TPA: 6-phosphofructokinase [Chitinophagales bacterium]|nr:6-phosphofructokinase [Chitinophagales bacterium]HMU98292.1 6-phosphofructokinase [Chitinophagales bacterium]HMV02112.1 6-phosphofructokinase [Chitinophagales bacterium]HMW93912.1 6-phosphofructokinase [Chitinophagales bacterium]HMY43055.1 6-phosphofructokinase [Chitinophagales bacterium]